MDNYTGGTIPQQNPDQTVYGANPYGPNFSGSQNPTIPPSYYGGMMPPPQQPPQPPQNKKTLQLVLIVVGAVLAIIAIVIGVLFALKARDDSDKETTEAVTTTAVAASQQDTASVTAPAAESTTAPTEPAVMAQTPTVPSAPVTTTGNYIVPSPAAPVSASTTSYAPVQYPSPVISWAETNYGSVLPGANVIASRTFGADQAIDGIANTCWCVNTSQRGGVGGTITIHLRETSRVSGIAIINGNTFEPEDDVFSDNGQVKAFTLTFSDGSSLSHVASFNYATSNFEQFRFSTPVITNSVTLRVDSAYVGNVFPTNVCIGEISVF